MEYPNNNNSEYIFTWYIPYKWYICSTQSWNLNNLGICSANYIIIVKKYFMRPNKIYIFRMSSTRSTKWCKNLSQIF